MSNRLGGKQGTAYVGTNAFQPPDYVFNVRNPTPEDINNSIGDFWLNTASQTLFVLVSLAGNNTSRGALATWQQLSFGGGGGTVTGLADEFGTVTLPVAGIIQFVAGVNTNSKSLGGNEFLVDLNNSITWPATDASGDGVIIIGGHIFLNAYGTANTFLGNNAGNLTLTVADAGNETGIGANALHALTTGTNNTALGSGSSQFITTGGFNLSAGTASLATNVTGSDNVALGANALLNSTGSQSVAVGKNALADQTTGPNIGVGWFAGSAITSGADNILMGYNAGANYVSSESDNIIIGNNSGVAAENNVLRLGVDGSGPGEQNAAFIAGIYNRSFGATSGVVQVDSTFKVGSSNGADGEVLIGGGTGPIWANIIPGAGIAITNGVNSIEIASTSTAAINCAFLLQNTPNLANQTGDGTVVSYGANQALTKIFDVGTNCTTGNGTGTAATFTAPATGKYYLQITINLSNINLSAGAGGHDEGTAEIVTTGGTYIWQFNPQFEANVADAQCTISMGQIVPMSNGDTATFNVMANSLGGGAKTAGLGAEAFISGFLVSGAGVGTVQLTADTGFATETAGNINVFGGSNIKTSATGSTVTIDVDGTVNHNLLIGNSVGAIDSLGSGLDGEIPIGSTGTTPVLATITAGTGITVTNGAGSITIAATGGGGGGGITWNPIAGTTQTIAVNNGYYCQNAGLTTITLPTTAAAGTIFAVKGTATNTGGWELAQNAGQNMYMFNTSTTAGVGHGIESDPAWPQSSLFMLCTVANTTWEQIEMTGNVDIF